MEVYKQGTEEILRRFMTNKLSYPDCVAALDAALASLVRVPLSAVEMVRRSGSLDMSEIRAVILANDDTMRVEMDRRRGAPC
jgi:hypothetical protein